MKCITLFLFMFNIKAFSGQTLILTGDSPYAILGHPFKWQCNGEAFPSAVEGIDFTLNGTSICKVQISQFPVSCSTFIVSPRLQCGCQGNNMYKLYLNISESVMADTGSWRCEFEAYDIQSAPVNNFVNYGPRSSVTINPSKHNIFVKEGSEVKIMCTATCLPTCSFKWLNDDNVLIANSSKLKVKNLQDKDTGRYVCEASNIIGTNSSSIYIQVLDEPLPPRDLKHVFSTSNTICLVWRAGDDSGASKLFHVEMVKKTPDTSTLLNWKPVGDDIDEPLNGGPVTSCIPDLQPSSSYYFRVYASNVHHIGNTSLPFQASTRDLKSTGLSFGSGLGLGTLLGLGLVIIGLFIGIGMIVKRIKRKHSIFDESDGAALVRNHPA